MNIQDWYVKDRGTSEEKGRGRQTFTEDKEKPQSTRNKETCFHRG